MPMALRDNPLADTAASRRVVLRALASAASSLALGGCGSALLSAGAKFDAAELSVNPTLLVATTRKPANGAKAAPWFGTERGKLTLARARLVPPKEGRFTLAAIGLDDWRLSSIETVGQFGELLVPVAGARDVLFYVHGYNQTFETAALDAAHLSDGIRFRGETMMFSWPSRAKLLDYVYDRESAMWSRDSLEQVLSGLITSPTVGRIHIVAHSVGTMVTMEALRQIYARHGIAAIQRIGAVVFAAPDIDMDVFSASVERVGALSGKITVIIANNDRALAVAGFIAGMTRVGAADKEALTALGLHVIDASHEGWGIINHDLFLSNAEVRKVIRSAIDAHMARGGAWADGLTPRE
jgi:esterase/lipase superfamily enzyme